MMEVYINTIAKLLYPTDLPRIGRELAEKMGSYFTRELIPDIKETCTEVEKAAAKEAAAKEAAVKKKKEEAEKAAAKRKQLKNNRLWIIG